MMEMVLSQKMKRNCNNREVSGPVYLYKQHLNYDALTCLIALCVGKFMQLPVNRIRNIINLDPDNKMVSKEALLVIGKATEAFM